MRLRTEINEHRKEARGHPRLQRTAANHRIYIRLYSPFPTQVLFSLVPYQITSVFILSIELRKREPLRLEHILRKIQPAQPPNPKSCRNCTQFYYSVVAAFELKDMAGRRSELSLTASIDAFVVLTKDLSRTEPFLRTKTPMLFFPPFRHRRSARYL